MNGRRLSLTPWELIAVRSGADKERINFRAALSVKSCIKVFIRGDVTLGLLLSLHST